MLTAGRTTIAHSIFLNDGMFRPILFGYPNEHEILLLLPTIRAQQRDVVQKDRWRRQMFFFSYVIVKHFVYNLRYILFFNPNAAKCSWLRFVCSTKALASSYAVPSAFFLLLKRDPMARMRKVFSECLRLFFSERSLGEFRMHVSHLKRIDTQSLVHADVSFPINWICRQRGAGVHRS